MPPTDLFRAELIRIRHRRAAWLLGLAALGVLILHSWTNHRLIQESRNQIESHQAFSRSIEERMGRPLSDDEKREIEESTSGMIEYQKRRQEQAAAALAPHVSHQVTMGFFGTIPGVALSVLLAATLLGAEFRWGYWKTLATHEPRRGSLLAGKLVSLWLLLFVGLALILILSYAFNALFARQYSVELSAGTPSMDSVVEAFGRAWLVIGLYATVAAVTTLWFRSSLAGLVGAIAFLLVDGVLLHRFVSLRFVLPVEQVAALLPPREFLVTSVTAQVWFQQARVVEEGPGFTRSTLIGLSPIDDWQAIAVLFVWILAFLVLGYLAVRSRDIPV